MRVKAQKGFAGLISMSKGQEMDIKDEFLLKDLLETGYVVAVEAVAPIQSKGKEDTVSVEGENTENEPEDTAGDAKMTNDELKALLKAKGLSTSGNKKELLERLKEAEGGADSDETQ